MGAVRLFPDTVAAGARHSTCLGAPSALGMNGVLAVMHGTCLWVLVAGALEEVAGDMGQCSTLPVQGGYEAKTLSKLKSGIEEFSQKASGMFE